MNSITGPDPDFPHIGDKERVTFPDPLKSKHYSIVAWGGNLSPGMLLSAYEQGIFPWYSDDEPVIWHSPDPRLVLFPEKLHISASMKKVLRQGVYSISFDEDFPAVIRACAEIGRARQNGTWITEDVISAYTELHNLGWAHSSEARYGGELMGGCYGIRLGNVFFGESMFSSRSNASKAAFFTLAKFLFEDGVAFIDCQNHSNHLESLGAEEISRKEFIKLLKKTLAHRKPLNRDKDDRRYSWKDFRIS
ncbi:MAG: leucyl/phenylalanyl-tRNA--protein transferase [Treponema sp.]|nr:leucyl/phenylalanyl-tRNA--protein transferase [Treponema sp.]